MTDAREIFLSKWPCGIVYDREQEVDELLAALHAAGFRILGPDEVDPMTLEKAADAAEEQAEWVPLKAGDMRAAIRSIGRKA